MKVLQEQIAKHLVEHKDLMAANNITAEVLMTKPLFMLSVGLTKMEVYNATRLNSCLYIANEDSDVKREVVDFNAANKALEFDDEDALNYKQILPLFKDGRQLSPNDKLPLKMYAYSYVIPSTKVLCETGHERPAEMYILATKVYSQSLRQELEMLKEQQSSSANVDCVGPVQGFATYGRTRTIETYGYQDFKWAHDSMSLLLCQEKRAAVYRMKAANIAAMGERLACPPVPTTSSVPQGHDLNSKENLFEEEVFNAYQRLSISDRMDLFDEQVATDPHKTGFCLWED